MSPRHRPQRWSLGLAMAAMGALGALALPCTAAAQAAVPAISAGMKNELSLSAEASREVQQDQLGIVLAAREEGKQATDVQSALRRKLDAALAVVRPSVRDRALEVRTGQFSVSPRYTNKPDGVSRIVGWVGTAELIIEGTDIGAVSQMAGQLNQLVVQSVGFSLSREAREQVADEVATEAIARFREQAERYARAFGAGGYSLLEARVNSGRTSTPRPVRYAAARMMSADAAPAEAQPVEAGKATVSVTVSGKVQLTPQ